MPARAEPPGTRAHRAGAADVERQARGQRGSNLSAGHGERAGAPPRLRHILAVRHPSRGPPPRSLPWAQENWFSRPCGP